MKDDKDSVLSKIQSVDLSNVKMPNVDLHSTIKAGVAKANSALSTMETTKTEASNFASSRIRPLATKVQQGATKAITVYENRKNYGPQIVAGSAAAVGILVAARRGKFSGALAGGLTGTAAVKTIYPKE